MRWEKQFPLYKRGRKPNFTLFKLSSEPWVPDAPADSDDEEETQKYFKTHNLNFNNNIYFKNTAAANKRNTGLTVCQYERYNHLGFRIYIDSPSYELYKELLENQLISTLDIKGQQELPYEKVVNLEQYDEKIKESDATLQKLGVDFYNQQSEQDVILNANALTNQNPAASKLLKFLEIVNKHEPFEESTLQIYRDIFKASPEVLVPILADLYEDNKGVDREFMSQYYESIPEGNPIYPEAQVGLLQLKLESAIDEENFSSAINLYKSAIAPEGIGKDRFHELMWSFCETMHLEVQPHHHDKLPSEILVNLYEMIQPENPHYTEAQERLVSLYQPSPKDPDRAYMEKQFEAALKAKEYILADRLFDQMCGYTSFLPHFTQVKPDNRTLLALASSIRKANHLEDNDYTQLEKDFSAALISKKNQEEIDTLFYKLCGHHDPELLIKDIAPDSKTLFTIAKSIKKTQEAEPQVEQKVAGNSEERHHVRPK